MAKSTAPYVGHLAFLLMSFEKSSSSLTRYQLLMATTSRSKQCIYGPATSEEHRPSLQIPPARSKTLPFTASVQHARNTNMMIQCKECELWHLIYSKYKLTASERAQLNDALADFTYTCGASLSDLDLSGHLAEVCIRNLHCYDSLEKLYYSMNK